MHVRDTGTCTYVAQAHARTRYRHTHVRDAGTCTYPMHAITQHKRKTNQTHLLRIGERLERLNTGELEQRACWRTLYSARADGMHGAVAGWDRASSHTTESLRLAAWRFAGAS